MGEQHDHQPDTSSKPVDASAAAAGDQPQAEASADGTSRRSVLTTALMAGGLAGGYGTFLGMAGRYFYRPGADEAWLFVGAADSVSPGESMPFESPSGLRVTVTRQADASAEEPSTADQFMALSSVCPHLGCQVHWEPHNDRYFCPCHNGVFDPKGKALEGPPAADGQNLFEYPLKVENGSLYIAMPFRAVGQGQS